MAVEESEETTAEEKIDEGEIEEESTEEDKEEEEDPERLTELEIQPGKTAYINFYYTIDPEIEGMKDQKLDFSFNYVLEDEDGKQSKSTLRESFRYAVDALNLMTVTAGGEKGFVETGKEDEMLLEFDLGQMREMLEEAVEEEIDKMENADASAAEAKRASASDLLIKWDDESSDGAGSKKDPAVIKNLKCEVETFGLKLEKFKAVPVKDDDNFGTSLKCNFYVSRKTLPGTYYGRVNASYKIKGKSFHTVQGFQVVVKQETGELELVGKIRDSEIVMTGPVSSFPKADELSLKVSEVTQEQQEKVDEALQKKAEEEGNEIKQYKALDIKLIADGEETEPEGDVQVRFKNVELENADKKKEAEQEKAEEQSIVKKAVRKVMSLFGAKNDEEDVVAVADVDEAEGTTAEESEKAAGTDEDKKEGEGKEKSEENGEAAESSENIKVLHLDEDAVVANEMTSEVKENGDVVMDTDHFSIYIVVNLPNVSSVTVEVHHYAELQQWIMKDKDGKLAKMDPDDGKYYYIDANRKIKKSDPVPDNKELLLSEAIQGEPVTIDAYTGERDVLYPGAAQLKENGINTVKYDSVMTEIYSPDTYQVPNGAGMGVNYKLIVENWGKATSKGRYTIEKIEIKNGDSIIEPQPLTEGDTKNKKAELMPGKNIINIYYTPTTDDYINGVGFHDYNVTIEKAPGKVRTNRVGMNNPSLATKTKDNDSRIGIGIYNGDEKESINDYLPHHISGLDLVFSYKNTGVPGNIRNKALRYGIPAKNIKEDDGSLKFKLNEDKIKVDPGLFVPRDITTTEKYYDGKDVTYYAKEYITDYTLKFRRNGDNYILTDVCDENGEGAAQNLDRLVYTKNNFSGKNPMYTNLFWPLDESQKKSGEKSIFKGIPGKQRDYKFGGSEKHGGGTDESNDENEPMNLSRAHNWFFGMTCNLKFTIGDYSGPMNYYFRGDDDLWLYVDGILVEDVDLGGTHQALPAYVDLKKWMKDREGIDQDLNAEHTMSIFFMERGGTGSCCYMAFTLPNVKSVPPEDPDSKVMEYSVQKTWLDGEYSVSRPNSITVQLYQQRIDKNGKVIPGTNKEYGIKKLSKTNGWSEKWNDLPVFSEVATDDWTFGYYAEEVQNAETEDTEAEDTGIEDYDAKYEHTSSGTTITNRRYINIPVTKIWEDTGGGNVGRPENIDVKLYRKFVDVNSVENSISIPQNLNGWEELPNSKLSLSASEEEDKNWKGEWNRLPLYEFDEEENQWKKILYTIQESQDSLNPNGWYEVAYAANPDTGFTITNTFNLKGEIPIHKECIGLTENETATFTFKMRELEKEGDKSWKVKSLSDSSKIFSPIDITVGGTNTNPTNKFIVEYKSEELGAPENDGYWYKWYEIWEDPKQDSPGFIYDKTHYVVEMKIGFVENRFIAIWDVENIYTLISSNSDLLEGQKFDPINTPDKEIAVPFVNYKKVDLEVSKKVENGSTTKEFDFTAEIKLPTEGKIEAFKLPISVPAEGVFESINNEVLTGYTDKGLITNDKGEQVIKVSFRLQHNSKVVIPLPVGASVKITEENHAGYNVSYIGKVGNDKLELSPDGEDSVKLTVKDLGTKLEVECTNTTSARLPDTGGPGLLMMNRLGWMLLLLALLMAGMEIQFYGERRNRKVATVQREDSRGFDSDDY